MESLRPYLQFARLAFQRRATYRLANWSGAAVNFFFLLVHAQVLLGFFRARANAGGWSASDAVLYFAASESLLMVIGIFPDFRYNLAERVRTGEIVSDLVRPVTLLWRELAERYGTGAYYLVTRAPAVFGAGWLVYGLVPPPRWELALFPLSLALAMAVSTGLWFLACSSAFWRESANGEMSAIVFVNSFLGGVFVPIDFYPPLMRWVTDVLPFRATLYTPVAILAGKLSGAELAFGLLHQVVWVAGLLMLASLLETRGLRRLAIQGG
ncbi:MAG TPA: ABC-2 family transporter protein [Myxococcota bacterium]|nr:ABC-2 family transporter protein [Myxococcota bacterium]